MSWTIDSLEFNKRKKITISKTNVASGLSNFPLLVKLLEDTDLGPACRSDGFDIRFTSSDGSTLLPQERELFYNSPGNCLIPNGTSTKGTLAHNSAFDLTGGGTVCAWIKDTGSSDAGYILSKTDYASSGGWGFYWEATSNDLRFYVGSSTSYASSAVFSDTDWVFVAVTWDSSGHITFYRNGVTAGTANKGSAIGTNSIGLVLGNRTGGTASATWLGSNLDQLVVFNRVLSASELVKIYNSGKGLAFSTSVAPFDSGVVACWDFNSSDGTDSSGNGYSLTMTDASYATGNVSKPNNSANYIGWVQVPSVSSASDTEIYMYYGNSSGTSQANPQNVWDNNFKAVFHGNSLTDSTGNTTLTPVATFAAGSIGKINKGFFCDGNSDVGYAADGGATDIYGATQKITISAWQRRDVAQGNEYIHSIVAKYGNATGARQYLLQSREFDSDGNAGTALALSSDGATSSYTVGATIPATGAWAYVSGVYNNSDIRSYVNGLLDSNGAKNPKTYTAGIYNGVASFSIGAMLYSGAWAWFFNGYICEVRVSNIDRSADWVKFEFYNMNSATNELTFGSEEEPTATATGNFFLLF